jgi:hypothetical protein
MSLVIPALLGAVVARVGYCDGEQCTSAPWSRPEVSAGLTFLYGNDRPQGVPQAEVALGPMVFGRFRPRPVGSFVDRLLVEGGATGVLSLRSDGATSGVNLIARVGLGWERFAFALGATMLINPTPSPVQALPSLALTVRPSWWAITFAVLDRPEGIHGPPARLTFEVGNVSLSYVAPVGAELTGRLGLSDWLALDLRAHAFHFWSTLTVGATAGIVVGRASVYRFGGAR